MTAQAINAALTRQSAAPSASKNNTARSGSNGWNQTFNKIHSSRNTNSGGAQSSQSGITTHSDKEVHTNNQGNSNTGHPIDDNSPMANAKHINRSHASNTPDKANPGKTKNHAGSGASRHEDHPSSGAVPQGARNKKQSTESRQKKHDSGAAAAMAVTAAAPRTTPDSTKQPTTELGSVQGHSRHSTGHSTDPKSGKSGAGLAHHPVTRNNGTSEIKRGTSRKTSLLNSETAQPTEAGHGKRSNTGDTTHGQASRSSTPVSNTPSVRAVTAHHEPVTMANGQINGHLASHHAAGSRNPSNSTGNSSVSNAVIRLQNTPTGGRKSNSSHNGQSGIRMTRIRIASRDDNKTGTLSSGTPASNSASGQPNMVATLNSLPGNATPASGSARAGNTNSSQLNALSSQSITQLNAQINSLHHAGGGSTQIELHPKSLGTIQVHVQMHGSDQAQVTFNAAQSSTAQAIQASLPQLATSMQQQGIQLTQPQVNTGGGTGSGQASNSGQQSNGNPTGQQSQGQNPQGSMSDGQPGQQRHFRSYNPMTALASGDERLSSPVDDTSVISRSGIRAYA